MGFIHFVSVKDVRAKRMKAACGMVHAKMEWTSNQRKANCPQCKGVLADSAASKKA